MLSQCHLNAAFMLGSNLRSSSNSTSTLTVVDSATVVGTANHSLQLIEIMANAHFHHLLQPSLLPVAPKDLLLKYPLQSHLV